METAAPAQPERPIVEGAAREQNQAKAAEVAAAAGLLGTNRRTPRELNRQDAKTPKNQNEPVEARGSAREQNALQPGTLSAEIALLSRAQQELRAGSPKEALALTREHAARFPDGMLKDERSGVEALARCALGQDRAQVWAEFERTAANSPLRARVRDACGVP
jgi:hypothetical protein